MGALRGHPPLVGLCFPICDVQCLLRTGEGPKPHPHDSTLGAAGFSSYDGDLSLPLGLALGSPIFPSGCEGKLGVALEPKCGWAVRPSLLGPLVCPCPDGGQGAEYA